MASSLGEPFSLASYSFRKSKGKSPANEDLTFASHFPSPKSGQDGLVTTAIHGDGVHVLNLTDMHPVSAHILGPNTLFATNPVTVLHDENGQTFRSTFAVIHRASGLKKDEMDKTVWSWKENVSETLAVAQEKTIMTIPIEASNLLASEALPSSLLFASRQGKIIRTDLGCKVINEWSPTSSITLDKAILIPRRNCKFIPAESYSGGAILLLIYTSKGSVHLQILSFGQEEEMTVSDPLRVLGRLKNNANVVDVTCDASGYLSVLMSDFSWNAFRLEISDGQHTVTPCIDVLHLRGFRHSPTRRLNGGATMHSISALSLGSSFVLIAGETDSDTPEIALLLWDIQYGILLHQQILQIPSLGETDGANKEPFVPLQLVPATSSHALLLISPPQFEKGVSSPAPLRHNVLAIPYSVPPSSTIASALGKASSGSRWLVPKKSHKESDSKVEGMLQAVQNAVEEEKPGDADSAFFAWVAAESSRRAKQKGKQPQGQNEEGEPDISSAFTHNVTLRLVQTLLPTDAKPQTPYSPKILRYLLERDVVGNSMIVGGLLPALYLRSDWESLRMCFSHVSDLPELDMIRLLHTILKSRPPTSDDAMVVDNDGDASKDAISSSSLLTACMTYPYSPGPLRTALRTMFSEGEELTTLLLVIADWLDVVVEKDVDLRFGELVANEHGILVIKQQQSQNELSRVTMDPPPSLDKIIPFLHALLDSSFITLLQDSRSHPLLRRIFKDQIKPQIALNEDLEALRGALQPFVKAHTATIADAARGNKKTVEQQEDWRKRRRRVHEQHEMALGPYQVEELVF